MVLQEYSGLRYGMFASYTQVSQLPLEVAEVLLISAQWAWLLDFRIHQPLDKRAFLRASRGKVAFVREVP